MLGLGAWKTRPDKVIRRTRHVAEKVLIFGLNISALKSRFSPIEKLLYTGRRLDDGYSSLNSLFKQETGSDTDN